MTIFYGAVSQRYTRNLFLRAFCTVYLSAFLSLYFQAPGLFGDNGILPARSLLENTKHKSISEKIHHHPTLLWLTPYIGLNTSGAVDFLALLGALVSFTGVVSQKFCIMPVFTALWSLFFSLYQIGQVFVSKNYDEFLLEAGFLAILMAPLTPGKRKKYIHLTGSMVSWMCRWLLFRFLFTAALGKLLSGCPKWWSLTALSHHFEVMPLPNPLSWYAHHLPAWFLKMSTVYTNVCELIVPFLFFLPLRSLRICCFHLELFLQICIVATGNFDHSNILVVTLLFSLLDDDFFYGRKVDKTKAERADRSLTIFVLAGLIYGVWKLYGIRIVDGVFDAGFTITKKEFTDFVEEYLLFFTFLYIGLLLLLNLALAIYYYLSNPSRDITSVLSIPFLVLCVFFLFNAQITIHSLHSRTNYTLGKDLVKGYPHLQKFRLTNQYNLFPKITGAEGRPEIILEGANNLEGPWKEYNFLYKPGNINHSLPFIAPYSPKLDWQMYWAARSTYDKQPWLLSLVHRLLIGRREVINLLDSNHLPFEKPPRYIRGLLYKYRFTTFGQRHQPGRWVREKVGEYFPPYTKDSPALQDFLKARNLLPASSPEPIHPIWRQILESVRFVTDQFEGAILFWSFFIAAIVVLATSSL